MILTDDNSILVEAANDRIYEEDLPWHPKALQYIASANVTDPIRQYAYNMWFNIVGNLLDKIDVCQFFINGSAANDKWNCRLPTEDTDAAFRATFTGTTHGADGITGTGAGVEVDNKWTALSLGQMTWFVWSFTDLQYTPSLNRYDLELPNTGITRWSGFVLRNTSDVAMSNVYGRTDSQMGGVQIPCTDSRGFFCGSGDRSTPLLATNKLIYANKAKNSRSYINTTAVSTNTMRIRPNGRKIGFAGATRRILTQSEYLTLYTATRLCFSQMLLI